MYVIDCIGRIEDLEELDWPSWCALDDLEYADN